MSTRTGMIPIDSHLLGPLEVRSEDVYTFPHGLYGFEGCHAFVLAPAGRAGLAWLQSLDDPALAFLLADPAHFCPDVLRDLPDAPRGARFVIVTLGDPPASATANLLAPVVLDPPSRTGQQVVRTAVAGGDHPGHAVRTPIALPWQSPNGRHRIQVRPGRADTPAQAATTRPAGEHGRSAGSRAADAAGAPPHQSGTDTL